ncbi:uncharacterized protein PITG_09568 [Phytophthora infestans T30-4]|uniref:Uncharacterized protein n=1 Tax=Phytophthora infestans (strain T30-4) TaxID=403677 RepID=D0NCA7_PHYIT|nr:uncharacterized protein PITG_09568 [Phytophthora infestans T30-4]EEY55621.1 hypothetical protein PITG_09568 [Phytophthora infestans T30-4]|eukprot:XP_002903197.1 hypothetical protein PITG_09568 [Phytophthora infestans T30-4]
MNRFLYTEEIRDAFMKQFALYPPNTQTVDDAVRSLQALLINHDALVIQFCELTKWNCGNTLILAAIRKVSSGSLVHIFLDRSSRRHGFGCMTEHPDPIYCLIMVFFFGANSI